MNYIAPHSPSKVLGKVHRGCCNHYQPDYLSQMKEVIQTLLFLQLSPWKSILCLLEDILDRMTALSNSNLLYMLDEYSA